MSFRKKFLALNGIFCSCHYKGDNEIDSKLCCTSSQTPYVVTRILPTLKKDKTSLLFPAEFIAQLVEQWSGNAMVRVPGVAPEELTGPRRGT